MRIFALSDLHADYEPNARWLRNLSLYDYQGDVLILAGDITDSLPLLEWCLRLVARRFRKVLFVPGNHELWTLRDRPRVDSYEKFERVRELAQDSGVSMDTFRVAGLSIVPLFSWYDYSFGVPSNDLKELWMDFRACVWPPPADVREIAAKFLALNESALNESALDESALNDSSLNQSTSDDPPRPHKVISFSHFLPRFELVPQRTPAFKLDLSPILGTLHLDHQVRRLRSTLHVYGHSHVNRRLVISGVTYVNNAFGYPHEASIAAKRLLCIHEH